MEILLSKKTAILLASFALSAAASSVFAGQKETCAGADTQKECAVIMKVEVSNGFPKVKHICQWSEDTCKPADNKKK